MHPALEHLLDELVEIAEKWERRVNDVLIKFPVPPSSYLTTTDYDDLRDPEYGEALNKFIVILCAYGRANQDWAFAKSSWISPAQGFEAQYDSFLQNRSQSSSAMRHSLNITLNSPRDLKHYDFDSLKFEVRAILRDYFGGDLLSAFELACRNLEGGLPQILRTISDSILKQSVNDYSESAINKVLGNAPLSDIMLLTEQVGAYKERYAAYLPSTFLNEHDQLSTARFRNVLLQHYSVTRRIKTLIY